MAESGIINKHALMNLKIRTCDTKDFGEVWGTMRDFTETRTADTPDEIWLVEHPPVYTLGRNGDPAHILFRAETSGEGGYRPAEGAASALRPADIPVVKTDRGGQVTYHGPGQLVVYTLFDLNRLGIGPRALVTGLENAVISALAQYGLKACARPDAPGAYVDGKKIASLGLRIRKGCSYHGLSLNVDMDLSPFKAINPCGFPGLQVTQLADLGVRISAVEASIPLLAALLKEFSW